MLAAWWFDLSWSESWPPVPSRPLKMRSSWSSSRTFTPLHCYSAWNKLQDTKFEASFHFSQQFIGVCLETQTCANIIRPLRIQRCKKNLKTKEKNLGKGGDFRDFCHCFSRKTAGDFFLESQASFAKVRHFLGFATEAVAPSKCLATMLPPSRSFRSAMLSTTSSHCWSLSSHRLWRKA